MFAFVTGMSFRTGVAALSSVETWFITGVSHSCCSCLCGRKSGEHDSLFMCWLVFQFYYMTKLLMLLQMTFPDH